MTRHRTALLLTAAFILGGCNSAVTNEDLATLTGIWTGEGRSYVSSQPPDSIPAAVTIVIDTNGAVTGSAGGARFTEAYVHRNRGAVARWLGVETDYKIEGFLSGRLSAADTSTADRRDIAIPFNIEADTLHGTLFVEMPWRYPYPVMPKLRLTKR